MKLSNKKSFVGNHLMWSYLTFGPILQGQTMLRKLESAYNSLIIGPTVMGCETNLLEIMD